MTRTETAPQTLTGSLTQLPGDRISVLGIAGFGHHGVLPHERRDGQRFLADVVLGVDTRAAAASDDLRDTVDYGGVVDAVRAGIETDPVDLVETLAERLAQICLRPASVLWAEVTVHKPDAPVTGPVADVTLTITRTRGADTALVTPSSDRSRP